jgi:hypothetical protein
LDRAILGALAAPNLIIQQHRRPAAERSKNRWVRADSLTSALV